MTAVPLDPTLDPAIPRDRGRMALRGVTVPRNMRMHVTGECHKPRCRAPHQTPDERVAHLLTVLTDAVDEALAGMSAGPTEAQLEAARGRLTVLGISEARYGWGDGTLASRVIYDVVSAAVSTARDAAIADLGARCHANRCGYKIHCVDDWQPGLVATVIHTHIADCVGAGVASDPAVLSIAAAIASADSTYELLLLDSEAVRNLHVLVPDAWTARKRELEARDYAAYHRTVDQLSEAYGAADARDADALVWAVDHGIVVARRAEATAVHAAAASGGTLTLSGAYRAEVSEQAHLDALGKGEWPANLAENTLGASLVEIATEAFVDRLQQTIERTELRESQ